MNDFHEFSTMKTDFISPWFYLQGEFSDKHLTFSLNLKFALPNKYYFKASSEKVRSLLWSSNCWEASLILVNKSAIMNSFAVIGQMMRNINTPFSRSVRFNFVSEMITPSSLEKSKLKKASQFQP